MTKSIQVAPATIQTVSFHGQSLITVLQNGKIYVAMKPIVENIGLQWDAQFRRIKRDEVLNEGIAMMAIPSNGGEQQMICLPIDYLSGWLFGIDGNRVKPEIRTSLIMYKRECYQALHDYWHKGEAINPRYYPYTVNPSDTLTLEQGDTLRDLLKGAVEKLPKDKKAAFMIQGWSKLRAHFKVGYRQIPQAEYAEALSIISRHVVEALEGELLPRVPAPSAFAFDGLADGRYLLNINGRHTTIENISHQQSIRVDLRDDGDYMLKVRNGRACLKQFFYVER